MYLSLLVASNPSPSSETITKQEKASLCMLLGTVLQTPNQALGLVFVNLFLNQINPWFTGLSIGWKGKPCSTVQKTFLVLVLCPWRTGSQWQMAGCPEALYLKLRISITSPADVQVTHPLALHQSLLVMPGQAVTRSLCQAWPSCTNLRLQGRRSWLT